MTTLAITSARRRVQALLACCAAGLLASGCAAQLSPGQLATSAITPAPAASEAPRETSPKGVKMAMLLPLGGFDQSAVVAKAMKQAGEMALFEQDNPAIQLVVKDDKGTPEGAKAAVEEAVRDGAEVILGPLYSRAVASAAQSARAANVPVLAFSNDRNVAGNGVYLVSFMAEGETERIVSYAAAQGKKRFAALIPDDAYGKAVEPAFRAAVARSGGSIVDLQVYPVQANGMIEPMRRVSEAIKAGEASGQPVDALFVPGGPDTLPQIGPLLTYSGVDTGRVKLIGTGAWDFPNVGREAALVGGWYPSPDPRGWQQFSEKFAKTFGQAPPRLASLAYDAVGIALALAAPSGGGSAGTGRFSAANLSRPGGFQGVDGPLRFNANGLAERGLAVLEVQGIGSKVVDPAPSQPASATTISAATSALGNPPGNAPSN